MAEQERERKGRGRGKRQGREEAKRRIKRVKKGERRGEVPLNSFCFRYFFMGPTSVEHFNLNSQYYTM